MKSRKNENEAGSLLKKLKANESSGEPVVTQLETDEKILARITDGIYRQPASAIRELISNSYDADAENVWIQTDAPRFKEIVIADDGIGFSKEMLVDLIKHIGASPKRTQHGKDLGLTSKDVTKSPSGRKLIGKIGIGLFSVAQLTRHFQVITKQKGAKFRLVADVRLDSYFENHEEEKQKGEKATFKSGDVTIRSEKATDTKSHGTQVVLMDIKTFTREQLQSHERWVRDEALSVGSSTSPIRKPPRFHIGSVDPNNGNTRLDDASLPWDAEDDPKTRFQKLYQGVLDEVGSSTSTPSINECFDNYLNMIWNLGLWAPLDYVSTHPFDLAEKEDVSFFKLSNEPKKQASEIPFTTRKKTVRKAAGLATPDQNQKPFKVLIDEIQLLRPIRFTDLPSTSTAAVQKPMMFIGQCSPDLNHIPKEVSGGSDLSFEAYFFWSPKVVPKENNGIIVRTANASGTLFDDTFMHYEVAELQRLKQITAEIFVHKGLEAALNIDRESFNYSHPHYQFLTRWVHRAILQLTNKRKELGKAALKTKRKKESRQQLKSINKALRTSIELLGEDAPANTAKVIFAEVEDTKKIKSERKKGTLVFTRPTIVTSEKSKTKKTKPDPKQQKIEEQMKVVAKILDAYGVLDQIPYEKQENLLRSICLVFLSGDDK